MVFSSLFFTFAFLPVTIILYYSLGKNLRNIVLLIASLFFYAWGEPVYVLLMCGSIIINYCIGILLGRDDIIRGKRKYYLIISLVFNLGCLGYFKYSGMIISTVAPLLPIGISFYTFQTLSYVIDVYRKKIRPQRSLILFALYITMFPQLVAGPIVNYADIESQLSDRIITVKEFHLGMRGFLCGLAKKVLLANNIGMLWSEVKAIPSIEISASMAWAGIIAFAFQIYFDFSGYSDMAIGLGKIFGFRFKGNFLYPYISQSISEFWRRWHISLGSWFKEYVYIPLGGSRVGKGKLIRNLFVVWFLTGLWHGASWNFVLWGLYFGILILIEKLFLHKSMEGLPKVVRHIYSLLFIVIGWVFFEFTTLTDIFGFLQTMFGGGVNIILQVQEIAKLKSYAILYVICTVAALPLPMKLALSFKKVHYNIYELAVKVYYCILIFLLTGYMVNSTYNPFIYFRF
ncbi:MBOAT family O-acyltransferase [Tissierella sp. Yu-01]|uniref:MBOAT family O-acyltransferase n=1 Tax=Tissierella sp. Yu-01 TaxID=3035694 RepID=UPI00240D175B|nr:MBOAT family O-acyltransferase [Tissierella sp. Yu-01]WFA09294.1 MBOAT family O-acyltransferase [Tissierella sp. Yu-01]